MAGLVFCVKPACFICGAVGEAACGYCFKLVCWKCLGEHCEHCATCLSTAGVPAPRRIAADYEDSPRSSTTELQTTQSSLAECSALSDEDAFYGKLALLWTSSGYGDLEAEWRGRLHRLPIMSRCSIYEPAEGVWRSFADLQTFTFLAQPSPQQKKQHEASM